MYYMDNGRLTAHLDRVMNFPAVGEAANLAGCILRDPQAHIDALVEAGVLERFESAGELYTGDPKGRVPWCIAYRVVQPHKHEWMVNSVGSQWVERSCRTCDIEIPDVPNRLPIEVPE